MRRGHRHRRRFRNNRHFRKYSLFQKLNWFCRKHPVISAGWSILLGIMLMRASFSNTLFGSDVTEFRMWILFASMVFFIIGVIAFKIWLKRNVPSFFSKHDINWRTR